MILERGTEVAAIEIKSGIAVTSDAFSNPPKWKKYATEGGNFSATCPALVYGGDARFVLVGTDVMG